MLSRDAVKYSVRMSDDDDREQPGADGDRDLQHAAGELAELVGIREEVGDRGGDLLG